MTLTEWLEDFKTVASKFTWKITTGLSWSDTQYKAVSIVHMIRGTHKNGLGFCGCPMTCYLYEKQGKILPDMLFREAAEECGVSRGVADEIASAADYICSGDEVRPKLLEVIGLAENNKGGGA